MPHTRRTLSGQVPLVALTRGFLVAYQVMDLDTAPFVVPVALLVLLPSVFVAAKAASFSFFAGVVELVLCVLPILLRSHHHPRHHRRQLPPHSSSSWDSFVSSQPVSYSTTFLALSSTCLVGLRLDSLRQDGSSRLEPFAET